MAKYTKIVEFDMADAWDEHTIQKLNYDFKSLQNSIGSKSGDNGPYNYNDLINTPTVEGSFEIVSYHPYGESHSFPATSSATGTLVIEKEGWWPVGVAGFSSGSVYLTAYGVYLSDIELGKCKITMYIYNRTSSAQTKTPSVQVLWAKWDNDSNSIYGTPLSVNDVQAMINDSIGDGTITIMQGDSSWSFTTNDSSNHTIGLSSGSGGSPYTGEPLMDGVANAGASSLYSRGDHRHPSDTSRVPTSETIPDADINNL